MFFLEDNSIGLRELQEEDAEGNYSMWFNDSEVCQYNSHHRFPMSKSEVIDYIKGLYGNRSLIVLAVIEKTTNKHIGNISLQQIDLINRQAEIAFIFGEKEYWGSGYATNAAKLLIEHAFKELGLNRLYFGTSEKNIGMQKVGEKLNFQRVGVRRKALYKNGSFVDIYDYDLLCEEWDLL